MTVPLWRAAACSTIAHQSDQQCYGKSHGAGWYKSSEIHGKCHDIPHG